MYVSGHQGDREDRHGQTPIQQPENNRANENSTPGSRTASDSFRVARPVLLTEEIPIYSNITRSTNAELCAEQCFHNEGIYRQTNAPQIPTQPSAPTFPSSETSFISNSSSGVAEVSTDNQRRNHRPNFNIVQSNSQTVSARNNFCRTQTQGTIFCTQQSSNHRLAVEASCLQASDTTNGLLSPGFHHSNCFTGNNRPAIPVTPPPPYREVQLPSFFTRSAEHSRERLQVSPPPDYSFPTSGLRRTPPPMYSPRILLNFCPGMFNL